MKSCWIGIIVIVVSILCALETRANDLKGPNGKPLPGATGGETIPPKARRELREPGAAPLIKTVETVEEDMKAHPDKKEGGWNYRGRPGYRRRVTFGGSR